MSLCFIMTKILLLTALRKIKDSAFIESKKKKRKSKSFTCQRKSEFWHNLCIANEQILKEQKPQIKKWENAFWIEAHFLISLIFLKTFAVLWRKNGDLFFECKVLAPISSKSSSFQSITFSSVPRVEKYLNNGIVFQSIVSCRLDPGTLF